MKSLLTVSLLSAAVAQQRTSANGCFQEGLTAYGNTKTGVQATDLEIDNSLSAKHRLYQIKGCNDPSGQLIGIQMFAAVKGQQAIADLIELTPFGRLSGSGCKSYTLRPEEYVTDFQFYFTASAVTGVEFRTNQNETSVQLGTTASKNMTFSFDSTFQILGLFGSFSAEAIQSLGAIRLNTTCDNFAPPAVPELGPEYQFTDNDRIRNQTMDKIIEIAFKIDSKLAESLGQYEMKWVLMGACFLTIGIITVVLMLAMCFCCQPDDDNRIAPKSVFAPRKTPSSQTVEQKATEEKDEQVEQSPTYRMQNRTRDHSAMSFQHMVPEPDISFQPVRPAPLTKKNLDLGDPESNQALRAIEQYIKSRVA